MRGAGELLARALAKRGACVMAASERPWASATFVGARHRVRLVVDGAAFLDGIEEAEFDLGEHLLADLVVVERERGEEGLEVTIEALTIEDYRPVISAPAPVPRKRRLWRWAPACAGVKAGEEGRTEPYEPTSRGTKGAFVPLAAA